MNDPIELLTIRADRQNSVLFSLYNPVVAAAIGVGCAVVLNWGFRKPIWSGIQKHVGFGVAGGIIGKYFDDKRNDYLAKRDAVLRHYIELHPDDFPPVARKKYADVLEPWVPIR